MEGERKRMAVATEAIDCDMKSHRGEDDAALQGPYGDLTNGAGGGCDTESRKAETGSSSQDDKEKSRWFFLTLGGLAFSRI